MMKTVSLVFGLLVLVAGSLAAGWWLGQHAPPPAPTADTSPPTRKIAFYQSPMHPWIKSDRPGKCTICGMDLVPIYEGDAGFQTGNGLVKLAANSVAVIGIASEAVTRRPLAHTLRVAGTIDDDDSRHRLLTARVPGRVEKLFVNYVGADVTADQPLATIFSPEALTAQREFVERLKAGNAAFSASDRAATRERLLQLGLTDADIAALESGKRQPEAILTVRAPFAGTIVSRNVYEGQYVKAEEALFALGDFSIMWFQFNAYEQDLPWLRVGQKIEVTTRAVPGKVYTAVITFIDPNLDTQTRSTRVRVNLPNPLIGSGPAARREILHRVFAEGVVQLEDDKVLAVPRSAVLNPGTGPVVYLDLGDGAYQQRAVRLGRFGDTHAEVLAGLQDGDKVVIQGNLLVDAQAQINRSIAGPTLDVAPRKPVTAGGVTLADPAALAQAAAQASAALAADDFKAYQALYPQLVEFSKGANLPPLPPAKDLKAARTAYEPWSTAVADALLPHRDHLKLFIYQCPMSPVLGKARWVQALDEIRNPFFGADMLQCGEDVR
jgi:Cu(I)/Ag(I) efflux system membrane fusion protein